MNLPDRVQVGPYSIAVVAYPQLVHEGEALFGRWDPRNQEMLIATGVPDQRVAVTFLHELLHAVADTAGVELPEAQVEVLATALFDALDRNHLLAPCWYKDASLQEAPSGGASSAALRDALYRLLEASYASAEWTAATKQAREVLGIG